MLIQIRGTSGSGKSTLVKRIMELYKQPPRKVYREGRKQPLYYRFTHPLALVPELAVIGHYEAKCGGCDTISIPGLSYPIIFDTIRRNCEAGRDVLFEGLLISGDMKWTQSLKDLFPLIIELDVPIEECLDSVNARRRVRLEKAGKEFTPVHPANTIAKHRLIEKCSDKLREFGIIVEKHKREEAFLRVRELLNV